MHPFYELDCRSVGTTFEIRLYRDGHLVLRRRRRPQPPQGGDLEITLEEIRAQFGPGVYTYEIHDAGGYAGGGLQGRATARIT
jgi:hypothetical protein